MKKVFKISLFICGLCVLSICLSGISLCFGFAVNSFITATKPEYPIERGFQKPMPKKNDNHQKIEKERENIVIIDKIEM